MNKTLVAVILVTAAVSSFCHPVMARPQYNEVYRRKHADDAILIAKRCAICHAGKVGTGLFNDFGTAFGEALGGKNIKEFEAIYLAIEKADTAAVTSDVPRGN